MLFNVLLDVVWVDDGGWCLEMWLAEESVVIGGGEDVWAAGWKVVRLCVLMVGWWWMVLYSGQWKMWLGEGCWVIGSVKYCIYAGLRRFWSLKITKMLYRYYRWWGG